MKYLAAFLLCFVQGLAFAQDMPPLKSWVDRHPQWSDNKTELAYLSNRCASAFDLVGNHFAVHAALDNSFAVPIFFSTTAILMFGLVIF
jgi:hypothetical protein